MDHSLSDIDPYFLGVGLLLEVADSELDVLIELGVRLPPMPRQVREATDDGRALLRARGAMADDGLLRPEFLRILDPVLRPRRVVTLERTAESGGYLWMYLLASEMFVEQVNVPGGVVWGFGAFDQLIGRMAANSGLLRRAPDGVVRDPVEEPGSWMVRVTVTGGAAGPGHLMFCSTEDGSMLIDADGTWSPTGAGDIIDRLTSLVCAP